MGGSDSTKERSKRDRRIRNIWQTVGSGPTLTSTLWYIPYPTKQVEVDYYGLGDHWIFDGYIDTTFSSFVLYTDGQLILPGLTYYQKYLSEDEIENFLAAIKGLGFFDIETNQQHDPTDKLYDFGDQYSRIYDGLYSCVFVALESETNICLHKEQREFAIPAIINILDFLDNYHPEGMTIYKPDRILVWVQNGRSEYLDDPAMPSLPWPVHLPSLQTDSEKVFYVDGKVAEEIFSLIGYPVRYVVFTQDEIEYTLLLAIVEPHGIVQAP